MLWNEQSPVSLFDGVPFGALSGAGRGLSDPVTEAAITGAALVRHLDDARFASLRALRQLLRALGAERVAIGFMHATGETFNESLAWTSGFGRCGESARTLSCAGFADAVQDWLATGQFALEVDIDVQSAAWHDWPCDHLLLVRGDLIVRGQGRVALAAQLRSPDGLPGGADEAIALFLHEYGRRHLQQAKV